MKTLKLFKILFTLVQSSIQRMQPRNQEKVENEKGSPGRIGEDHQELRIVADQRSPRLRSPTP